MDPHLFTYVSIGFLTIIMAWLPFVSQKIKISYPVFLILLGFVMYGSGISIPWLNISWSDTWIKYISEAIVIISLMGSGLKIGKNYKKKDWIIIFRLIAISMPIFLLGVFFFGYIFLGFSLPVAVLLAAVLSPTDPVLASEVQIQQMSNDNSIQSKFALTGEAGINDGLAFPFTILAITLLTFVPGENHVLMHWFLDIFLLKVSLGLFLGYIFGRIFGWAIEKIPSINGMGNPFGFISLSITFFVYASTELLHGYGFLAVFICAVVMRHREEIEGKVKYDMHNFIEQSEKLLLVLWLLLFTGAVYNGVLSNLDVIDYIFAFFLVFILRPISSFIGLIGSGQVYKERFLTCFFGIRGIGSIFYLSWAFVEYPNFPMQDKLYAIVCLVILCSIIIHGITAPYFVSKIEKNI